MNATIEKFRGKVPPTVLCVAAGAHVYTTPRLLVDRYFRRHERLTDRLAIGLAAKTGAPCGWSWERHIADMRTDFWSGNFSFREPPRPWQRIARAGECVLCRRPIYKLGWHRPWGANNEVNTVATWHAVCKSAFLNWTKPGFGVAMGCEADHFIPLYQVYRALARDGRWPDILWYWSYRNIQILTAEDHRRKSAREAAERARFRVAAPPIAPLLFADEVPA